MHMPVVLAGSGYLQVTQPLIYKEGGVEVGKSGLHDVSTSHESRGAIVNNF